MSKVDHDQFLIMFMSNKCDFHKEIEHFLQPFDYSIYNIITTLSIYVQLFNDKNELIL